MPPTQTLPRIRGTQRGLRDPALVERLKSAMLQGNYQYLESRGRIAGWRDRKGTYHIGEGHHRMVAAMEIYRETGAAGAVFQLLECGEWAEALRAPRDSRPLPARHWWGRLRNWLGF